MIFINLSKICADNVCEGDVYDLKQLGLEYEKAVKTLSNTLMTTVNASVSVKPDVKKAKDVQKKIHDLVSVCKKNNVNEDDLTIKAVDILKEVKKADLDLQKMGTFENIALNTARINAIDKSNKLIGVLLGIGADDAQVDEEEDYKDDEPEEEEETEAEDTSDDDSEMASEDTEEEDNEEEVEEDSDD